MNSIKLTADVQNLRRFNRYWAVRPVHGMYMGQNIVDDFQSKIKDLVEVGEADKSKRKGEVQIQDELRARYRIGWIFLPPIISVAWCQVIVLQSRIKLMQLYMVSMVAVVEVRAR